MAKTLGRACAQIAILLTIYGSIQCVKSISPDAYNSLGGQQLSRQRRVAPAAPAAPADSTPVVASTQDAKNQYQSVSASVNGTVGAPSTDATVTTVDSKAAASASASAIGNVAYNVQNVGVNGAGQRKDPTGQSANAGDASTATATSINVAAAPAAPAAPVAPAAPAAPAVPPKKTQMLAASQPMQYPKKVAASSVPVIATTTERSLIDEVDVPDEVITNEATNASLTRREDHFDYYSSVLYVSKEETSALWTQFRAIPENNMLSSSHRRAMTVELKFSFPFYGHYVRNITVATGGFLYTGEYVHSWLAATQYIAPLMANFDTSMSNDSFVRLQDNGTAFTVVWENATLQDKPEYGRFTFSATLHQTGDIVFVYYQLPTLINNIQDSQHPVKVGLSDAYIVDKMLYFARRKTIYEYHRVTFTQQEITNATVIILTALPTCLGYNDCQSCMNHKTTFKCAWCPMLNRCSTNNGNDRRKQDWQQKGCDRSMVSNITACPALGQKGNNAAQENGGDNNSNYTNNSSSGIANSTPAGGAAATEATVSSTKAPENGELADSNVVSKEKSEHLGAELPENKNVGVAFGFMVPICLVFAVTLWLFYAYRNPHTRSGQFLIQFRPSQWSWRRGEARYTAATIHM